MIKPLRTAAVGLLLASTGSAAEFYRDFRTREFDSGSFERVGPDAEQFVESGPAGLRIKFLDGASHEPTGITTRFPIRGNFEITTTYQIDQLDAPTTGYGVGVGLYVETDSPTKEGLTLERFVVPRDGEVIATTRARMKDGARTYEGARAPAQPARSGQLRLTRQGAMVTASVRAGNDPDFRTIRTVKVSAGEVTYLRLAGDTGGAPSRLDATFQDLKIADDLPTNTPPIPISEPPTTAPPAASEPAAPPSIALPPTPPTRFNLVAGLGVGLVVVIGGSLILWNRWRANPR